MSYFNECEKNLQQKLSAAQTTQQLLPSQQKSSNPFIQIVQQSLKQQQQQQPNIFPMSSQTQSNNISMNPFSQIAAFSNNLSSFTNQSTPQMNLPTNGFQLITNNNASNNIFTMNSSVTQAQSMPSLFQNQSQNNFTQTMSDINYSDLNELNREELNEFRSNEFTIGRIPIRPPPKNSAN